MRSLDKNLYGRFSACQFACLLLLLIGISIPVEGSVLSANDPKYLHQIWRTEDGLPNAVVRTVIQSKDGYLWFATDESLVRFDGTHFAEFDRRTGAGRGDRWVVGVTQAKDGSIWSSSANGGIARFKDGIVRRYAREDGLPNNWVLSIFEDSRSRLWVGTAGGLGQWEHGRFLARTNEPGLEAEVPRAILEDRHGTIWLGTAIGLTAMNGNKFTRYTTNDFLINDAVMCLFEDSRGALWIGTADGLTQLVDGKPRHYTTKNGLLHKTVRAICEDDEGTIWVGTQGGVQRIVDGKLRPVILKNVNDPDFEGISFVYSLSKDAEGNIWVGSNLGLSRLRRQKFQSISTDEGLLHNLTTLVYEDSKANVWIGTYGGGLSQLQPNGIITTWTTANGLVDDHILALCEDHHGDIWIGTDGHGIQRLHNGDFTTYQSPDVRQNTVRLIFEDGKTNLWFCSNAGALHLVDDNLVTNTNFPRTIIKTVLRTTNDTYWVGWQDGLMRITPSARKNFTEKDGLLSAGINTLYQDSSNVLWIGTDKGLNILRSEKFLSCSIPGLRDQRILQILEDDFGRLWFGTRDGIFCAPKVDLENLVSGRGTNVDLVTFGKKDGMRRAQCNGIASPAGWKSKDGRIWFATMHGVVVFDPKHVRPNSVPPPIVIDEVLVDQQSQNLASGSSLPPGHGEIEFHFTALSYAAPELVKYKFKLVGFDSEWREGSARVARYTNLRPGNYTFKVHASSPDGVWNEGGATIAFAILPHFYQSYWFYILCIGAVIVVAAGLHFYRVISLREREGELLTLVEKRTVKLQEIIKTMESFNYSIAHDLRAPLRAIKGFTNALVEDYSATFDDVGRDYSKRIQTAVDRMDKLIDDLLIFGRITHKEITLSWVPLDVILARIQGELAAEISQRHGRVTVRKPLPRAWANETLLQQVLVNLISNGLKFVPGGVTPIIEVWAEETAQRSTRIYVRDNGIGIDPKHHQKIFGVFERLHSTEAYPGTGIGLAIVQKAIERMDGKVGLKSMVGEGSCFWVELPHPDPADSAILKRKDRATAAPESTPLLPERVQ